MAIKHAFTSSVGDGGDATLVRPSNWNADHAVDSTGVDVGSAIALNVGPTNATSIVLGKDTVPVTFGVHWDDLQGPAVQGVGNAALTQEAYRDTAAVQLFMRHDQDDSLTFNFQMTHRWKVDTECKVHMHYIPMVTPEADEVVRIQFAYAWALANEVLPANTSWTTSFVDITIPSSGADTFKHKLASLFNTTPSGASVAAILIVRVTRLSSSASDTYTTAKSGGTTTANLCVLAVDAHIQLNTLGTTSV